MSASSLVTRAGAAPEPLLVDAPTAAGMLSISERLLWSLTQAQEIGAVRIGKRVLYPVQGLRDWVAAHTEGGPAASAAATAVASIETPPHHDLKHRRGGPPVRPPTGTTLAAVEGER